MTVVLLTTTGAGSWTVPAGVTSVRVECWGGGGGGYAHSQWGAGGGAYSKKNTFSVSPGAAIPFFVGAGGNGQAWPYIHGGDTWFSSTTTVLAKGGVNGTSGDWSKSGKGGQAAEGIGDVKFSGGDAQGNPYTNPGGGNIARYGGGASASPFGNGGNQTNGTGGSSPGAGAGGAVASTQSAFGASGTSNENGGGAPGGDGVNTSNTSPSGFGQPGVPGAGSSNAGVLGARGQIRITYELSAPTTTLDYQVSTDADDGFYSSSNATLEYVILATYGRAFFRFPNIAIPTGATITSAKFSLYTGLGSTGNYGRIYCQAVDNAPAASASNVFNLPVTSAYTPLLINGSDTSINDHDVTALLKEIVGRAGWLSGNAVTFIADPIGRTGTATHYPYDYSDADIYAARFSVTFSGGSSTPPVTPTRKAPRWTSLS